MKFLALTAACLLCVGNITTSGFASDSAEKTPVDYERDIRPLLNGRCLTCHGPDEPEADLDLTSRQSAVESGAIVPNEPEASWLLKRVEESDDSLRMPPDGKPLTADQIEQLKVWIETGADWPRHWSYRPLKKPAVPSLRSSEFRQWCRTPID